MRVIHLDPIGPAFLYQGPFWRTAFLVSYVGWGVIELGIWSRDRARVKGERTDRFSMLAIVIGITAGIFAAFYGAHVTETRISAPGSLLVGLGIALIWTGILFRLWSVRTLGRFFRVTVTTQDDHRLIDSGPYSRLSNPSYTGAMITMAGLGLAMGNWASLAGILLFAGLGFAWRIRVEEDSLRARFGAEFDAYRKARWALIPPLW
jgi:protein-S-isoprenylcysteine O-methyltransferase Ste14